MDVGLLFSFCLTFFFCIVLVIFKKKKDKKKKKGKRGFTSRCMLVACRSHVALCKQHSGQDTLLAFGMM
jgi:hypothetical protein